MIHGRTVPSPGRVRLILTAAAMVLYAAVFLYPFHWAPPRRLENHAERSAGGWRFPDAGLVRSRGPAHVAGDRFDVEIHFRSASVQQRGPARIFTISEDPSLRNITLGQDGTDLILRVRAPGTSRNGTPEHRIPGVFRDGAWHVARVTVNARTVDLFVDGALRLRRTYAGPVMATWDRGYSTALGNELTGRRPWLGEIEFHGDLERPDWYWTMEHTPRWLPFRNALALDLILNFLGFLPLGLLLARLGWSRSRALLICACLSLGIEGSQLALADRYSSSTDVLLNACGGLTGAWMARWFGGANALADRAQRIGPSPV